MKKPTKAVEDYLEALLVLENSQEPLETTKVADFLHVSKPAVNQMANELIDKGYITRQPYGDLVMTESGRAIAKKVYHRHVTIKTHLIQLGVSEATAEKDCCLIEHVISEETFRQIEKKLR